MNRISSKDWVAKYEPDASYVIEDQFPIPNLTSEMLDWQRQQSGTAHRYFPSGAKSVSVDVLLNMRLTYAAHLLEKLVEIDPQKAAGIPVIAGTRFKISQLLAELAEGHSIAYIARQFDLEKAKLSEVLDGISIYMDQPFIK